MRVVVCYPAELPHLERIRSAWGDAEVVSVELPRLGEELLNADMFCGHAKLPLDWDSIVPQGRLRWIQSSAAGMDHCLAPSVVASDILVSSASGLLAKQVADHAVALLAGSLRNLPTFFRAQQLREYVRRPTRDLFGSTVGIVGLGGNGRLIARVLKGFSCTLLATDWFSDAQSHPIEQVLPPDQLDDILPHLDALILAAPLTQHTAGMIDTDRLGRLPPGAVLINVARGGLVIEDALAEGLRSGRLWGAGIDVAAQEPLPPTSPLWEIPNLIITPHVGGQRASRIDDMTDLYCRNIARFQQGRPLINQIDKRLGFPHPDAILTSDACSSDP